MDCVEVKQETTANKQVEDNTCLSDGNNDSDNKNDPFNNSSDESICDYNSDNDPFKEDKDYKLKNEDPFEVNNMELDETPQEAPSLNESAVKETSSTGATLKDYIDLPNYEYGCKHCDYVTKTRQNVFGHLRKKHMNYCRPIRQCPHCPFKTDCSRLKYHIIARHKKESEIDWMECHQCGYKCKYKFAFMKHLLTHKTLEEKIGIMLKCDNCPKMFRSESILQKHIRRTHDENKPDAVRCHLCGQKYCDKASLNSHFKRFHSSDENMEMLSCYKCSYKTKFKHLLTAHARQHDKRIQCEKCPYRTHNMAFMKLHKINHQEEKNEKDLKYRCDKCDYKTYRDYSLKVHMLNHLKPKEIEYFYCYHCEFKAKRKDNLKTHIKNLHFKKKTEFVCYICDFKTNTKVRHIAHLGKHSTEQNKKQKSEENRDDKKEKRQGQSPSLLRTTRSQKKKLEKSS